MHSFFRWSAICASLIAGTFASEFVSTQQELSVSATAAQTAARHDAEMPAKVAFRGVTTRYVDALNQ